MESYFVQTDEYNLLKHKHRQARIGNLGFQCIFVYIIQLIRHLADFWMCERARPSAHPKRTMHKSITIWLMAFESKYWQLGLIKKKKKRERAHTHTHKETSRISLSGSRVIPFHTPFSSSLFHDQRVTLTWLRAPQCPLSCISQGDGLFGQEWYLVN